MMHIDYWPCYWRIIKNSQKDLCIGLDSSPNVGRRVVEPSTYQSRTERKTMAPIQRTNLTEDWPKWQIALAVAAPIVVGAAGLWYYKKRKSAKTKRLSQEIKTETSKKTDLSDDSTELQVKVTQLISVWFDIVYSLFKARCWFSPFDCVQFRSEHLVIPGLRLYDQHVWAAKYLVWKWKTCSFYSMHVTCPCYDQSSRIGRHFGDKN